VGTLGRQWAGVPVGPGDCGWSVPGGDAGPTVMPWGAGATASDGVWLPESPPTMRARTPIVALVTGLLAVAGLAACGTSASDAVVTPPGATSVPGGPVVAAPTSAPADGGATATTGGSGTVLPADNVATTAAPIDPNTNIAAQVGVTDNRLFLLGDSILGSMAPQYTDEARDTLRPLGWQVTIDAVTNRATPEGYRVLRNKRGQVGEVIVIQLGNNDGGDAEGYSRNLGNILDLLADTKLVVLMTINEFKSSQAPINDVIYEKAAQYPNVRVIDWDTTIRDNPQYLVGDRLHLTESGAGFLADYIGTALGPAPGVDPATVAQSPITNPHPGGTAPATTRATATTTTRAASTTTSIRSQQASTTSTTRAGGATTTVTSTIASSTTQAATSTSAAAPTTLGTQPPSTTATAPITTAAPPTTAPPATDPPATSPPSS
jgi:hypothetical protein